MLIAAARSVAPGDERKAAAGLESHDEKFQTREREKSEPLGRFKIGLNPIPRRKRSIICEVHNPVRNNLVESGRRTYHSISGVNYVQPFLRGRG
jgi:hypothetical protein